MALLLAITTVLLSTSLGAQMSHSEVIGRIISGTIKALGLFRTFNPVS
jgi:hypothetical protein